MSITDVSIPLVAEGSGGDRAAVVQGLIDAAIFLAAHEGVPLPGDKRGRVFLPVHVPTGPDWPRGRRVEFLQAVAEAMGVPVFKDRGVLYAEREFGPVILQAHVNDADYIPELLRAADERTARSVA